MMVRPRTLEAHLSFCSIPYESFHYCMSEFLKYWSWTHFHSTVHSYNVDLDSLYAEEDMMRRDLESLY